MIEYITKTIWKSRSTRPTSAVWGLVCLLILSTLLFAQGANPTIKRVTVLPSEMPTPGACKASTSGYLGTEDRTELSEAEIGKYVSAALRDGYVLTLYPPTKRGVFVNAECNPR